MLELVRAIHAHELSHVGSVFGFGCCLRESLLILTASTNASADLLSYSSAFDFKFVSIPRTKHILLPIPHLQVHQGASTASSICNSQPASSAKSRIILRAATEQILLFNSKGHESSLEFTYACLGSNDFFLGSHGLCDSILDKCRICIYS